MCALQPAPECGTSAKLPGKASGGVWIVKTAREEHAKAIEWLNEHTDIIACAEQSDFTKIHDTHFIRGKKRLM